MADNTQDESQRTSPSVSPTPGPSPENFRTVVTEIVQQAATELIQTLNVQMESYVETTLQKAFDDLQLPDEDKEDRAPFAQLQQCLLNKEMVIDSALSSLSKELEPRIDGGSVSIRTGFEKSSLNIAQEMCNPPASFVLGTPSSDVQIPMQEDKLPGSSQLCAQEMFICTSVCSIQDIQISGSATSTDVSHESSGQLVTRDISTITSVCSIQQVQLAGMTVNPETQYPVSYDGEDHNNTIQTQKPIHIFPQLSQEGLSKIPSTGISQGDHPILGYVDDITSASINKPLQEPELPASRSVSVKQQEQIYMFQEQTTCSSIRQTSSTSASQSSTFATLSPSSSLSADIMDNTKAENPSPLPALRLPTPSSVKSLSPALSLTTTSISLASADSVEDFQEELPSSSLSPVCLCPIPYSLDSQSPTSIDILTPSPARALSPALITTSSLLDMAPVGRETQEDFFLRLPTPSPGRTVSPASNTLSPVLEVDSANMVMVQQNSCSPVHRPSTFSPLGTPSTLSNTSSNSFASADIREMLQECCTHSPSLTTDQSPTTQLPMSPFRSSPTPLLNGTTSKALTTIRSSSVAYTETCMSVQQGTISTLNPAIKSPDQETPLTSTPDTVYNVTVSRLHGISEMYEVTELPSSPGRKCFKPISLGTVPTIIDSARIFASLPSEAYTDESVDVESPDNKEQRQEDLDYICSALDSSSSPILKLSSRTPVSSRQDTLDPTITFISLCSDREGNEDIIGSRLGKQGNPAVSCQEPRYYQQPVWKPSTRSTGSSIPDSQDPALDFTSNRSDTYANNNMRGLQREVAHCLKKQDSYKTSYRLRPDSLDPDFISTSIATDTDEEDEEFLAAGIMNELMEEAWVDSRSGQFDLSTPPAPSITPNFAQGILMDDNEGSTGYPASQEISTQTSVSSFQYHGNDESLKAADVEDCITDHPDYTQLQKDTFYLPAWNTSTMNTLYKRSCPQDDNVTKACVMRDFLEGSWNGRDPSLGLSLYHPFTTKLLNETTKPSKMSPLPGIQEFEEMSLEDLVQQLKKHPGQSAQDVCTESYHTQSIAAPPPTDLKKSLSVVMKEFFDSLDEREMKEMSKGLHTIVVKDQLVNLCIEMLQLSTQTIVSLSKSSEMFTALNHSLAEKSVEQNIPQSLGGKVTDPTFRTSFSDLLSNIMDKGAIQGQQEIKDGIVNTVTDEVNTILSETVSLHTRHACSKVLHSRQISTCGPCKNIIEEVSQEIKSIPKHPGVKTKRPWCLTRWCKGRANQNCSRK